MDPALSITSRGPISEPSEVESGAHRAMQLDRGFSASAPSQPHEVPSKHFTTAPYHSTVKILVHGMAMGPSETNPHKARAATCQDRQLLSFSPFFFFPLLYSYTQYPGHNVLRCNPPGFENGGHDGSDEGLLAVHAHHARRRAVYAVSPGYYCPLPPSNPRSVNPRPTLHYRSNVYTLGFRNILIARPGSSFCDKPCSLAILARQFGQIKCLSLLRQVCLHHGDSSRQVLMPALRKADHDLNPGHARMYSL